MDERARLLERCRPYVALVKFLAPVALTCIAIDIGEQALNRSLASSFDAVDTLAGFGISYVIIKLATGMLSEIKIVSIMLIHSHSDRRRIGVCLLTCGCLFIVLSVVISLSDVGYYVIDVLHRVPPNVGQIAKDSILYLSVFPLIDGIAWMHTGVLLRFKYSFTVGFASVLDNVVQVVTVVILLQTRLSRTKPIVIPVLATYLGTLARLSVVLLAYYKCIHSRLHSYRLGFEQEENKGERLSFKRIVSFWAPLALVQICQRISRPIVNLFVARERLGGVTPKEAVRAVAILSVCYPLGHLPYGWLNTLRSVEPAFTKKVQDGEVTVTTWNIRVFQFCCFLFSFMLMIILFWIPGIAPAILENVSDIDQSLIKEAVVVLHVFSFFPIPSANRAVLTGQFVASSNTKYLYPSIPVRIITLVSMLFILPRVGVHGSLMGMCSLISGFCLESLCSLLITCFLFLQSKSKDKKVETHHKDADNRVETTM